MPIVFGGHDHYYVRAVVAGVQHISTGGGGAPHYAPNPSYPNVVATAMANHFCEVDIDGSTLTMRALTPAGAALDSFTIQNTAGGVPEPPSTALSAQAAPIPFSTETVIRWPATGDPRAEMTIVGAGGRVVRRHGALGPDARSVRWNGTDDDGRPEASGVYFARLKARSMIATKKIVLAR